MLNFDPSPAICPYCGPHPLGSQALFEVCFQCNTNITELGCAWAVSKGRQRRQDIAKLKECLNGQLA